MYPRPKISELSFRKFVMPMLILVAILSTLNLTAQRTIVAIGDSNGASKTGWVIQLKLMRPLDSIFNYSISGNTMGFDNLGDEKLNTLKNIDDYLADAKTRSVTGTIDDVVILLGTNDCKAVFKERGDEVLKNLENLIKSIQNNTEINADPVGIFVGSPPPIADDSIMLDKYKGGDVRLKRLLPEFMAIALRAESYYIDIYNELRPNYDEFHTDGIHLNKKGSKMVSASISRFLDKTAKIAWDDTMKYVWPEQVKIVDIPSPLDGEIQKAYFYKSTSTDPQPLIVSLHTWSGDYTQQDPLIHQILDLDWNYIHPDFRGVNNTPKACGSKFAIDDIEQAILFAIENKKVDPQNIHVIGASGGGYATLYTYLNSKHNIASFNAWVPISDIEAWYYQSIGRKNKYAGDILAATKSKDSVLNVQEARLRSPLFMDTPVNERAEVNLRIYAGVHDGYTGSVPIIQSLEFYNKTITDFGAAKDDLITENEMLALVTMRDFPVKTEKTIGSRRIIFQRSYKNISLTIFEGTHEMLTDVAINLLQIKNEN